jgi:hypothetical protein
MNHRGWFALALWPSQMVWPSQMIVSLRSWST